jgi:hypothetical protein
MLFPRSSPLPGPSPLLGQWQHLFLKNTGIPTSFARTETSAERTLREQFVAEQKSSANLVEQVDELKRKKEKTERGFEKFKIQQQKEYNQVREDIMCFSSFSGKFQSSTLLAMQ